MHHQAPSEHATRTIVVTGTGTEIGKTHIAEALLHALAAIGWRTAGLKPVETGVDGTARTDAERLAAASTFHVKHSAYAFVPPISPHLAAREANAEPIQTATIADFVSRARRQVDLALVELAGGLFSPLTDSLVNADAVKALAPDYTLLVAPDRLGVLHDVFAACRAASTVPLSIDAIVLSRPERPDASTGRNGAELRRLSPKLRIYEVPRASSLDLARSPAIADLAAHVTGGARPYT